jgi:hypothetical protein
MKRSIAALLLVISIIFGDSNAQANGNGKYVFKFGCAGFASRLNHDNGGAAL